MKIRCAFGLCIMVGLFAVVAGVAGAQDRRPRVDPGDGMPPPTGLVQYIAQVAEVSPAKFPFVRLNLSVEGVGNVIAEPYYVMSGSRVDYASPTTQQNLVCYYLLPGDRITFSVADAAKGSVISNVRRYGPWGQAPTPVGPSGAGGALVVQTKLGSDKGTYAPGETVHLVFTVTNTSPEAVRFATPSLQKYDFIAYKNETVIWRWSDGRMFGQAIGQIVLQPGESVTYSESWALKTDPRDRAIPGTYKLVAKLATMRDVAPPTATTTITISDK